MAGLRRTGAVLGSGADHLKSWVYVSQSEGFAMQPCHSYAKRRVLISSFLGSLKVNTGLLCPKTCIHVIPSVWPCGVSFCFRMYDN